MKSTLNNAMLNLLGGDLEFNESSSIPIPDSLTQLLSGGFTQQDGLNFFRSLALRQASLLNDLLNRDDETGIEATMNHVHIEDFLDAELPFFELARLGNDFAFVLAKALHDERPNTRFRVIVSAQPRANDAVRDSCVIRFHALRKDQSWLDENLENYGSEAVRVFDV